MTERRQLAYRDRTVRYLTQTLSTHFDDEPEYPPFPFTDQTTRKNITINLNADEYTMLLSAIMTGADLAFPDIAHELEMIMTYAKEEQLDTSPVGIIVPFIGLIADIPPKWLPCNNTTYVGADYPELFAMLKATFISGANFHTPIMQGHFIMGATTDSDHSGEDGSNTHVITVAQLPAHHHIVPAHSHTVPARANAGSTANVASLGVLASNATITTDTEPATDTSDTGSGTAIPTKPLNYRFHYIIKALP